MPTAASPLRRRAPASLLERNRSRILSAMVEVVGDAGWAGMTIASVARAAGLSPRPVQDRFPDRWAMAGAAWQQLLGPALETGLAELLAAAGLLEPLGDRGLRIEAGPQFRARLETALASAELLDGAQSGALSAGEGPLHEMNHALALALEAAGRADHVSVRAAGPSALWLTRAYEPFIRPTAELRAAAEILVVSEFNDDLSRIVAEGVARAVAAWCTPTRADVRDSTRRAYLTSTALGLLLARTRRGVADLDLACESELLMSALSTDIAPVALPDTRAEHLDNFLIFDTGDPVLDALLSATLEEVGRFGFDGATTAGIGRASGFSEGLIFGRYGSKVDLFVDATLGQHARNWRANEAFVQSITLAHGPGIAEAVVIREFQRPELRTYRAISLEQVRMALHDERLREAQWGELDALVADAQADDPNWHAATTPAHLHMSVAAGLGVTVLPIFAPDSWRLPYDVVSIPLNEP